MEYGDRSIHSLCVGGYTSHTFVSTQLAVERETAGSVCLFSALVSAIERSQAELMEVMEMSRRAAEHQADAMIRQLELEVQELRRRESALAELAQSDDPSHCVKVGEKFDI